MIYYGTRLSENISRREPEGYLFCLNVPVARTGTQEYMPEELDLPPGPCPVPVFRPESEVFSPETIASFEGMPVTNNHPPGGVTVENIRAFQKGHAHNVRRGAGDESDLLLADLVITDPALIGAILAGKREISCGYAYELCEENGRYIQHRIRGNHVAVVDAGRAGRRVSIKDEQPSESMIRVTDAILQPSVVTGQRRSEDGERRSYHKPERRKPLMKKTLLKKLTRMARDGDPEAFEALLEAAEEIVENPSGVPETAVVVAAGAEPGPSGETVNPAEEPSAASDHTDVLSAILERLDQLIALLSPAVPAADSDPEQLAEELAEVAGEAAEAAETAAGMEPAGASPEEIASLVAEIVDPAVSTILEQEGAGDEDENRAPALETGDVLRAALQAFRPVLKRMPRRDRVQVCADIAARLKKTGTDSRAYAALAAAGPRRPAGTADLGRKIMAARNPNYRART